MKKPHFTKLRLFFIYIGIETETQVMLFFENTLNKLTKIPKRIHGYHKKQIIFLIILCKGFRLKFVNGG